MTSTGGAEIEPPLALLAELTHRCPLRCPYCSNPRELARASDELDTASWSRVFTEAAALGALQVHFSGGEPLVRRDLVELVDDRIDIALAIDQAQDLDRLLVGQQQPLGREHYPGLSYFVKAEPRMRRKAQDCRPVKPSGLGAHRGTKAPGETSRGST